MEIDGFCPYCGSSDLWLVNSDYAISLYYECSDCGERVEQDEIDWSDDDE